MRCQFCNSEPLTQKEVDFIEKEMGFKYDLTNPIDLNKVDLSRIIRVITWNHHPATAEEDIYSDVMSIAKRYNEIKEAESFYAAKQQAREEWLMDELNKYK
jgi:hypothetical protein